jgi:hypothetical protein
MVSGHAESEGWQRDSLEFAFYHSLVDDDPLVAAPALEALGRVAAAWSRMEVHLDALIVQVNKPDHSEVLFEAVHPISFSKKLDLLKRWFNRYPPLAEYRGDVRFITSRLKLLSKEDGKVALSRNVLLHAIPASFDAGTGNLVLHHMKFRADGNIVSRHITLTLHQLGEFFKLVQLANKFLGHITTELFTVEGYEKLRRPE